MKHAGRNLISVPFAHYDGADNKTSHDSETYTFILLTPKEYYEKNEKLDDAKEIKEILGSWKRGAKLSDKANKRRGTPLMAIINPRKEEDAKIKK